MRQTKYSFSLSCWKTEPSVLYYRTEHNEACDIHPWMYIYKFLSGTGQSENISELIHEKDFFKIFEIIYVSEKC